MADQYEENAGGLMPAHATDNHRTRVAAERRERMRARLLQAALRLVAEKGVQSTTIDDVISAAQVSRGTFYKYFPSPDALVRALAAQIANGLVRITDAVVPNDDDPAAQVARGIRVAARVAVHHPAFARFLLKFGLPEDPEASMFEFARRDIEKGFSQGRFRRMPMQLAINIVTGAVLGAISGMLESNGEEDSSEAAAAVALRALGVDGADAEALSTNPLDADDIQLAGQLADALGNAD